MRNLFQNGWRGLILGVMLGVIIGVVVMSVLGGIEVKR